MWNRTRTVRIGLAFTRELMEPFHTEPESGTRTGPSRKKVPNGTEPKSSRVNSQNRSRQVPLRNDARGHLTQDS